MDYGKGLVSSAGDLPDDPAVSILKPKLDCIFAEVERNLPSIDFELSDVSSDEESGVQIFQRTIQTPTFDDDKDLDESLSTDAWDDLFQTDMRTAAAKPMGSSPVAIQPIYASTGTSTSFLPSPENTNNNQVSSKTVPAVDSRNVFNIMQQELGMRPPREAKPEGPPSIHSDLNSNVVFSPGMLSMLDSELGTSSSNRFAEQITEEMHSMLRPDLQSPAFDDEDKDRDVPETKKNTWVDERSEGQSSQTRKPDVLSAPSPKLTHLDKNKKHDLEKEKLSKRVGKPEVVVSRYFTSGPPTLPLESLQDIDIDALLGEGFTVTGPSTSTPPASPPRATDTALPGKSLLEQLAQLSLEQSGVDLNNINPVTGAVWQSQEPKAKKTAQNISVEAKQKAKPSRGVKYEDIPNLPRPPQPPQKPDRKTVYIDLRGFDLEKYEQQKSIEAVHRILKYSQPQQLEDSSDSSDDEGQAEGGVGLWHAQRKQFKQSVLKGEKPDLVKEATKPKAPEPEVRGQTHLKAQRLAHSAPPRPTAVVPPDASADSNRVVTEREEAALALPEQQTDEPAQQLEDAEKQRRQEAAKKLREQKESQRQSRLRLRERLEVLRPETSSKGKWAAAESTPTLYDVEASYEPAPQTLPSDISPDVECTLLTVRLSSNGEIVMHRSSTQRSVDTGHGLSASYTTLLTWLLANVPDDFTFLDDGLPEHATNDTEAEGVSPPFQVVGLQQKFYNDELCLYIAVCPKEVVSSKNSPNKPRKTKKRDELKNTSAFQQLLTKYLSTNTLHTVCYWLQDLISMEVSSAGQDTSSKTKSFVYKPPLPHISTKPLSTFMQINPDPNAVQKMFGIPVGFFWQTVESEEQVSAQSLIESDVDFDTQNTMSLIYKKVYRDPRAMMGILNRVLQEGLDLTGFRVLYPTPELVEGKPLTAAPIDGGGEGTAASHRIMVNNIGPILALAIRGTFARTLWLDAVGPSDPCLARRTDPNSLCAMYGGESRDDSFLFCPRNPTRIVTELSRWFGGRVPPSGVIDVGQSIRRDRPSSATKRTKKVTFSNDVSAEASALQDLPANRPPATLTATTRGDILLVISSLVPTRCLGLLLATCQRRGYQLRGIRRVRLSVKRASSLGVAASHLPAFVAEADSSSFPKDGVMTSALTNRPSTILVLHKENSLHNAASLIEAFMVQMTMLKALDPVASAVSEPLTSSFLFHVTSYTDGLLHTLGGDFSRIPESEMGITPGYIAPRLYTNPEMEQIVVLTLTGHHIMKNFGLFLAPLISYGPSIPAPFCLHILQKPGQLLKLVPYSRAQQLVPLGEGFELVGVKWLPSLSVQHAKELTPYEVGDKEWKPSIHTLTSEPAVILALRGINAFRRMESIVSTRSAHKVSPKSASLEKLMSPTPELAYRQATLFFFERELFADPAARPLLPYLPPAGLDEESKAKRMRSSKSGHGEVIGEDEALFSTMLSGPRQISTILVAKPDVVYKHLSKLLRRITHENFTIIGMRLQIVSQDLAERLIPKEEKEDVLRQMHIDYLLSGPSLIMCVQRENAVKKLYDLVGPNDPQQARRQNQGFWRAMFGSDIIANGLYISEDYALSIEDQKMFFPEGLCCQMTAELEAEQISCPAEDSRLDLHLPMQRKVMLNLKEDAQITMATKSSGTSVPQTLMPVTPLTETTCVIMMPELVLSRARHQRPVMVDIVEEMISQGFQLVGTRMVWLQQKSAEILLHLVEAGTYDKVPYLTSGPCLVLALQRDNAILAFDSTLSSSYTSEYKKHQDDVIRPKDTEQAHNLLAFFFDHLLKGAQATIVPKE